MKGTQKNCSAKASCIRGCYNRCAVPSETRHNLTRPLARGWTVHNSSSVPFERLGALLTYSSSPYSTLAPIFLPYLSLLPPRFFACLSLHSPLSLTQYRTVRLRRTMRRIQFYTRALVQDPPGVVRLKREQERECGREADLSAEAKRRKRA